MLSLPVLVALGDEIFEKKVCTDEIAFIDLDFTGIPLVSAFQALQFIVVHQCNAPFLSEYQSLVALGDEIFEREAYMDEITSIYRTFPGLSLGSTFSGLWGSCGFSIREEGIYERNEIQYIDRDLTGFPPVSTLSGIGILLLRCTRFM